MTEPNAKDAIEATVTIAQILLRYRGEWCVNGIDETLREDIRRTVFDVTKMLALGAGDGIADAPAVAFEACEELEKRACVPTKPAWLVRYRSITDESEATMTVVADEIADAMTEAYRIGGEDAIVVVGIKRHGVRPQVALDEVDLDTSIVHAQYLEDGCA